MSKIGEYLFKPRFFLSRFQFNLIALFFITTGLIAGTYLAASNLSRIFAAGSPWTQTDWSGGQSNDVAENTVNTYLEATNVDTETTPGEFSLSIDEWKYRRKLTFDNTSSDELANFPVLVKLDSSRIDYSNTQDSGQDIRFMDADSTTPLAYEIEKWDESGNSYVWVRVPQIDENSDNDFIYMYYGNEEAEDAQNPASVWDANYKGVWHLNETSGALIKDSTGVNNGTKTGVNDPAATPVPQWTR